MAINISDKQKEKICQSFKNKIVTLDKIKDNSTKRQSRTLKDHKEISF